MSLDIPVLLDRLRHRYPSLLVDRVVEYEPGQRVTAVKNVTVNEEYFQGHFPGNPLMPGVMMIETFAQVATLLLLGDEGKAPTGRTALRGVNNAKFRKQVLPGDRLCLEVTLRERPVGAAVAYCVATVAGQSVAEAELLVGIEASTHIDPTATFGWAAVAESAPPRSSPATRNWGTTARCSRSRLSDSFRRT